MKIISTVVLVILLQSCAVSGRVCGGAGGKRCVEMQHQTIKPSLNT